MLLVVLAVVLLFVGDQVELGAAWTVPARLRGHGYWTMPSLPVALAGLAAVSAGLIALLWKPARIPVGVAVLAVTLATVFAGWVGLVSFYDAGGLGLALGIACLLALWLLAAGRRRQTGWSDGLLYRVLAYLTLVVVMVPAFVGVGVSIGCANSDDDMCGMAGLIVGVPAAVVVWLLGIAVSEVVAARRRRSDLR